MSISHHPVADLFPMLSEPELHELAVDIAERGLLQPIVRDKEGRILDGRNRYAACEIAGVEPQFTAYDGDDPDGYALAVNVARRHLKPSQRYMITEMARRLTGARKSLIGDSKNDFNKLSEAAVVLDYRPDLAAVVAAGDLALYEAVEQARAEKQARKERQAKLDRLRAGAPDLIEKYSLDVETRTDALDEAIGALEVRESKARERADAKERQAKLDREKREAHAARLSGSFRLVLSRIVNTLQTPELQDELVALYDPSLGDTPPIPVNTKVIREAAQHLTDIADKWESR